MEFVLMIFADESQFEALPEAELESLYADYARFNEEAEAAGALVTARRLDTVESASTQRVRDGETLTTDGPFAETKEQFAGFYLLDCADRDEALTWAARLPGARVGSVEVRPVRYAPTPQSRSD
jgi:hypothetical protein